MIDELVFLARREEDPRMSDVELEILLVLREGQPVATVVVDGGASAQVKGAAQLLVDYVECATGARLPLASVLPPEGAAICIGSGAEWQTPDQADLDADGFDIAFPDESIVVIAGPTDWGTEFGVCEFLERYVGVYEDPYLYGRVTVSRQGETLSVDMPQLDTWSIPYEHDLIPIAPHNFLFVIVGEYVQVTFILDASENSEYFRTRIAVAKRSDKASRGPAPVPIHGPDRLLQAVRREPVLPHFVLPRRR